MNIFDIKIRDWTREEEKYIDEDGVAYTVSANPGPFTKKLVDLMKQVMRKGSQPWENNQ